MSNSITVSIGSNSADRAALIKLAEHNPLVQRLYMAGLVDRAEEVLHVHYGAPDGK